MVGIEGREVGGAYIFQKKREKNTQIIGLKRVWFKLRLFDSRFCTLSQVAVHSRPPRSPEVRKPAEKEPTCQLI